MLRRAVAALLFFLWTSLAHGVTFYPSGDWFWIVADTTPTTTVWKGTTGAMEANSSADYQAWVGTLTAQNTQLSQTTPRMTISGTSSNGGLIRVTGDNTFNMVTNDVLVVNGTGTVADGTWTVTVIDSNCAGGGCRVDLQGSTFSGSSATTGVLGGGTKIATAAALYTLIDNYNKQVAVASYGYSTVSLASADLTLTNPIPLEIHITNAAAGRKLLLPAANLFGSVPIGFAFSVYMDFPSGDVTIQKSSGVNITSSSTGQSEAFHVVMSTNNTGAGSWNATPIIGGTNSANRFLMTQASGGVGQVTAACSNLSNAAASCATDATNATNISSGTLAAVRMAAFGSGDVSFAAAGGAGTIAPAAVTLAKQANLAANSIQGNNTGSSATPLALTVAQVKTLLAYAFSDLSGSATCAQMPAGTGDVTSPAGSCANTAVNLPTGVTMAGSLLATEIAAPSTPAAGKVSIWVDSTDARFHDINPAGTKGTTVVADTGAANNFLTAISAAGVISKARPTCSNLSDSSTGCTTTVGTIATQAASAVAITGGTITGLTGFAIRDTSAAFDLTIAATSGTALTAGRTLTLDMGNVAHTLVFGTTANTITFPNTASGTVAMLNVANNFTAAQTITLSGASSIVRSGSAGSNTWISIGRTAEESIIAVPSSTDQFAPGAVAGDLVIRGAHVILTDQATGSAGCQFNTGAMTCIGALSTTSTTDATSTSTGAIKNTGGMSVNKRVWMNGLSTSSGVQNGYVCQAASGELIADSGLCLASSVRFKEGLTTITDDVALSMVLAMQPKSWRYRHEPGSVFPDEYYRERIGFIAEDLAPIDRRLVSFDNDGQPRSDDYFAVITLQAGAIRSLKAANDNLAARIDELERRAVK